MSNLSDQTCIWLIQSLSPQLTMRWHLLLASCLCYDIIKKIYPKLTIIIKGVWPMLLERFDLACNRPKHFTLHFQQSSSLNLLFTWGSSYLIMCKLSKTYVRGLSCYMVGWVHVTCYVCLLLIRSCNKEVFTQVFHKLSNTAYQKSHIRILTAS